MQLVRLRRGRRLNPPHAQPSNEGIDTASNSSTMSKEARMPRNGRCMVHSFLPNWGVDRLMGQRLQRLGSPDI
jgi:hypothetical protein